VWWDIYYANFASKVCHLNKAMFEPKVIPHSVSHPLDIKMQSHHRSKRARYRNRRRTGWAGSPTTSFTSSSPTTILINGHWSMPWARWSYLDRIILNLVLSFVMQTTQLLQFTLNGIWFSSLERKEHWLHMTWIVEMFMWSLPVSFTILDLVDV
jgi:hypothetical protein